MVDAPAAQAGMPVGAGQSANATSVPAKQFAIDAARMLADTRCHNVVVLDVTGISPVTDFFVIATGTSPRQMRTACDAVEEMGEPMGYAPLARAGEDSESWMLLDCVHVVVHVFSQDARMYYDLDGLWGDARRVKWERDS